MHIYFNLNGDGTKEVENELCWLRNFTNIDSVCAHNCYYVFGAENFEIFKELTNRESISYKNKKIPLAKLSVKELNITEINYPIIKKNIDTIKLMDKSWKRTESFNKAVHNNKIFYHNYNINIWCVGRNEWLISNNKDDFFIITQFRNMIKYLDNLNSNIKSIVFNLHPIYFSN